MTLEQMDALVRELDQLKCDAQAAQEKADAASALYQEKRQYILDVLKANKRDKYQVTGVGTVYISQKEVYRVPKTNEEKNLLFTYIKDKYGPDTLMGLVGIHSATLTAWANQESESGVMTIPGLEAPTMVETLNFRRK